MSLDTALARIARTAARLCEANGVLILLRDGTRLRAVARSGQSARRTELVEIERTDAIGRSFIERRTIHVRDLRVADTRAHRAGANMRTRGTSPIRTQLA